MQPESHHPSRPPPTIPSPHTLAVHATLAATFAAGQMHKSCYRNTNPTIQHARAPDANACHTTFLQPVQATNADGSTHGDLTQAINAGVCQQHASRTWHQLVTRRGPHTPALSETDSQQRRPALPVQLAGLKRAGASAQLDTTQHRTAQHSTA
jgi:hypothetical protein